MSGAVLEITKSPRFWHVSSVKYKTGEIKIILRQIKGQQNRDLDF